MINFNNLEIEERYKEQKFPSNNISGVYTITNILSNKIYVGSSKNVFNRLRQHQNLLVNRKHSNRFLQSSWNIYSNYFRFELLLKIDINFLESEETYWINVLNTTNSKHGFNIHTNGYRSHNLTDETKLKISNSHLGKKLSKEAISKIVIKNTGQIRERQSLLMKERWDKTKEYFGYNVLSEEEKQKLRNKLSKASILRYKDDNNVINNTFIKIENKDEIKYFRSITKASKYLKVDKNTVKANIDGIIKKLDTKIIKIDKEEYMSNVVGE